MGVLIAPPASATEQPKDDDAIVARVGNEVITTSDFSAEMELRSGGLRGQYTSVDQRRMLLEEMIRERLMIAEARRQGLDKSPEVLAAVRKLLITQLSRDRIQPLLEEVTVSDEEVRRAYEANLQMYQTPERIRGAIIEFRKPRGADEETLEKLYQKAEAIHALALELPSDSKGFGPLARRYSDDRATRYIGGMLPWLYAGQGYKWGSDVVGALFGLDSPGAVGPIIDTENSIFLVRLAERDGARQLSLDRYASGIRNQLIQAKRQELRAHYYAELEEKIGVDRDLGPLATLPSPTVRQESPKALPPSPTGGDGGRKDSQ